MSEPPEVVGESGDRIEGLLALASDVLSDRLIIPMIIQTIGLDRSGAVWTDAASNVSSLDPSGAIQGDAEHPTRNRKVEGSNPSPGSKTPGQSTCRVARRMPCLPPRPSFTENRPRRRPAPLRWVGVRLTENSLAASPP